MLGLLLGASALFNCYLSLRVWWLKRKMEAQSFLSRSFDKMLRAAVEQAERTNESQTWPDRLGE